MEQILEIAKIPKLRFTTTESCSMFEIPATPLCIPDDIGEFIEYPLNFGIYIHGKAEEMAGFDIPCFIDGNLYQVFLPLEEQNISMMLLSGEYKCKAILDEDKRCCLLVLDSDIEKK